MGVGEIADMDVVTHRRAIVGRKIRAKNFKVIDVALQRHHGARDQMGLDIPILTDVTVRIIATGIEVAKSDPLKLICGDIIRQDRFTHELRSPIRIYRFGGSLF
jgi:hypothetical protein